MDKSPFKLYLQNGVSSKKRIYQPVKINPLDVDYLENYLIIKLQVQYNCFAAHAKWKFTGSFRFNDY